jgi:predicted CXXCH cytochrome family protein
MHKTPSDKKDSRTGKPLTCTGCHMPHGSEEKALLRAEPTRELCILCHDPTMPPPPGKAHQ